MFDTASISVLLKVAAVSVLAIPLVWIKLWPEVPPEAVFGMTFLSFLAGAAQTSIYFLVRYKEQLTPPEVSE